VLIMLLTVSLYMRLVMRGTQRDDVSLF